LVLCDLISTDVVLYTLSSCIFLNNSNAVV